MSNFYLDQIEDKDGNLVDILAYHRFCAPDELKARGDQPCCLDQFESPVHCEACGEWLNDWIEDKDATLSDSRK